MPPQPRRPVGAAHSRRYRDFLKRLRQARIDAELTQAAVGKALGKPQSFVAKCESGERRVDVIELEGFARLYKTSILDFLPRIQA